MAQVEIIQLTHEDGTPFYPNITRQPVVLGGLFWIWNPALNMYSPTNLMATGEGRNLFALTQSPQVITHNFGTKPSVTVLALCEDNQLHEVIADILYSNNNEVAISWNGGSVVYAYIV